MTADEAEALFLAGLPGPAAQLGLGTVVAAAQLKVMAALPPELRSRASRIVERFHLDAAGWFHARRGRPPPRHAVGGRLGWPPGPRSPTRAARGPGGADRSGRWGWSSRAASGTSSAWPTARSERIASRESWRRRRWTTRSSAPTGFDLAAYWDGVERRLRARRPDRGGRRSGSPRTRPGGSRTSAGRAALDAAERLDEPDPDGWLRLRLRLSWPDEVADPAAGGRPEPGGARTGRHPRARDRDRRPGRGALSRQRAGRAARLRRADPVAVDGLARRRRRRSS